MNSNFKLYSQYYDLLYQDKDYKRETDYIVELINKYHPNGNKILELGSGTGIHAELLAQHKYTVLGLERSEEMVFIANQRKNPNLSFQLADITKFNLHQKFDLAISLFHVLSYVNENEQLIQTFKNVHDHLNHKGIFIFDVWHSSAVYHLKPEKRSKVFKNNQIEVMRYANPVQYTETNVVNVHYDIHIKSMNDGTVTTVQEEHPMRYFSKPELELLAYGTGFKVLHSEEFLTKKTPAPTTWGVCYILQKI